MKNWLIRIMRLVTRRGPTSKPEPWPYFIQSVVMWNRVLTQAEIDLLKKVE